MWDIICIFIPFSKTSNESFSIAFPKYSAICESWKVGSTKPLNTWDLSSQYETPTTPFLQVPINVHLFAFHSMTQRNHVNRNKFYGVCTHGLSQFGPCLGKMPFGFWIFFHLNKLTSTLEDVQDSYMLFIILYRHALDLERKATLSS